MNSIHEWLNDKANDGPLVPSSRTTSLLETDRNTYDCMKEILGKRFPNKKSFFKFRNNFISTCKKSDGYFRTETEAYDTVVEIIVNKILTALNLDNPDTEEDTYEPRPTSMKLEVPVDTAFNEYEIMDGLRRWIEYGKTFPELGFRIVGWPDGFNGHMTAREAEERFEKEVPDKDSVLKAVEHEQHARSLVYEIVVPIGDAVDTIARELTAKIHKEFDEIQKCIGGERDVSKSNDKR